MTSKIRTVKELARTKFEMPLLGFHLSSCLGEIINL